MSVDADKTDGFLAFVECDDGYLYAIMTTDPNEDHDDDIEVGSLLLRAAEIPGVKEKWIAAMTDIVVDMCKNADCEEAFAEQIVPAMH